MERPHIRLHEVAREAVAALNREDRSVAEAGAEEVRRLSHEIVSLLERLERRMGGGESSFKSSDAPTTLYAPLPEKAHPEGNGKKTETATITRIVWDESLATGEAVVDEQHRKLISQINALIEAMKEGKGRHQIEPLLEYLTTYTRKHFGYEEDCMEKHRCPVAAVNAMKHGEFVKMLENLKSRYERDGASSVLAMQVRQELGDWFINHIRKIDARLGGCIHQTQAAKQRETAGGNGKGL